MESYPEKLTVNNK